jgi:hypothetical protein
MNLRVLLVLVVLLTVGCANVERAARHPTRVNERQYNAAKAKFEGRSDLPNAPPMKRL